MPRDRDGSRPLVHPARVFPTRAQPVDDAEHVVDRGRTGLRNLGVVIGHGHDVTALGEQGRDAAPAQIIRRRGIAGRRRQQAVQEQHQWPAIQAQLQDAVRVVEGVRGVVDAHRLRRAVGLGDFPGLRRHRMQHVRRPVDAAGLGRILGAGIAQHVDQRPAPRQRHGDGDVPTASADCRKRRRIGMGRLSGSWCFLARRRWRSRRCIPVRHVRAQACPDYIADWRQLRRLA